MLTVDKLKQLFAIDEDQDLGKKFMRSKGAVSQWRKDGLPAAIERRAVALLKEEGIISEDFAIYGVKTIQRSISPGEENLLKILTDYPDIQDTVRSLALLPERKRKIQLGKILEELEKIEG